MINTASCHRPFFYCLLLLLLFNTSCASLLIKQVVDPLEENLNQQTDLSVLKDGMPALLLLHDALMAQHPGNKKLLITGARGYSSYTELLLAFGEKDRAKQYSMKAKEYGLSLLGQYPELVRIESLPLDELDKIMATLHSDNVDLLFWGASAWSTWIRLQEGAPSAINALFKVQRIMRYILKEDENFYFGGAHIFMGFYYGTLPPMYGGNSEKSKKHFEKALALADHRFLLTKVLYAESYAKQTMNRDLYISLLQDVLAADLKDKRNAAANMLAKFRAEKLLTEVDSFF